MTKRSDMSWKMSFMKCWKCQGISKAHWHDKEFEGSVAGSKCGFPFMARGDADIVVPCSQVKLGVNLC